MKREMLQLAVDISEEGNVLIIQRLYDGIDDDVQIVISPYQIDTFIRMLREVQEEVEMHQYLDENEVKQ